jgi:hypothetical protein
MLLPFRWRQLVEFWSERVDFLETKVNGPFGLPSEIIEETSISITLYV